MASARRLMPRSALTVINKDKKRDLFQRYDDDENNEPDKAFEEAAERTMEDLKDRANLRRERPPPFKISWMSVLTIVVLVAVINWLAYIL